VLDRILILKTGLNMASENPVFGRGAGAFRQLYQKYQAPLLKENPVFSFLTTSYAHDDYLQLLSEFGGAGLLLYLLFFISLLYRFDRKAASLEEDDYVLKLGLASSLLCVFIEGFFNFPLFVMPAAGLFWLYAGLLHGNAGREKTSLPVPLSRVLFAALALPALLALILTVKPVFSNFYLKQGVNEASRNSNFEMDYYSRSIALDPYSYYAYFYAGYYLSQKREYEKSAWHYKRALDVFPNSADAVYNIASCLKMSGNPGDAVLYYEKALELYPGFALARLNLGKTYMDLGREEEGLNEIAASKKLDPQYSDVEMKNYVESFVEATWEYKEESGIRSPESGVKGKDKNNLKD
jgi:tetratricopeptide (TPR) repeat protein